MKKDDYFVIVHNVLNYLYEQLKNGTTTVESITQVSEKLPKKVHFRTKMHCSNCSIYA